MTRKKVELSQRITHWFTNHPWIKIISFLLAVVVWMYVKGEINRFN